jgi:hypothetical protein
MGRGLRLSNANDDEAAKAIAGPDGKEVGDTISKSRERQNGNQRAAGGGGGGAAGAVDSRTGLQFCGRQPREPRW